MEPPSRPRRKKRRGSGLLGDAVSRFMGKGKRNPNDVSVSMDSLRSRAKKTAARLKQNVGKHYNLMFDKAQVRAVCHILSCPRGVWRVCSTAALLPMQYQGIPIREGLQGMYRIERDRTIRRCGLFTLHFALLLFIVSNVYDVHVAFTTNDAITDLFLDEPFEDGAWLCVRVCDACMRRGTDPLTCSSHVQEKLLRGNDTGRVLDVGARASAQRPVPTHMVQQHVIHGRRDWLRVAQPSCRRRRATPSNAHATRLLLRAAGGG